MDHRKVIHGNLHRLRTGVQGRDLPERFGPWKTGCERLRLGSADVTWECRLQQVQAAADAAGEIDWAISVDSTNVRPQQHAADARSADPPPAPGSKGAEGVKCQDEAPWQSLVARLVDVMVRVWAARGVSSPARST
ncbi:transposase [Streptomyces sp. NPDC006553]|uniref:transposase n=1 Tax=Streptomyces sp. NPDC006553 TaxID=3157180 RepID=UPI0033A165AF